MYVPPRASRRQGVLAGDLEEAHRDARNTLEGMLSLRPDVRDLEEKGYLEVRHVLVACRVAPALPSFLGALRGSMCVVGPSETAMCAGS